MTERSTRNKIRHAAKMLQNDCDNMLTRLKRIDDLAEGQSDTINAFIPDLVNMIEATRTVFIQFRKQL